jgi:stage II sporulation protein P
MNRRTIRILAALLCCVAALFPQVAKADDWDGGQTYYTVYKEDGDVLFSIGGEVYLEDEYISGDNKLYRVVEVDTAGSKAIATLVGDEEMPGVEWLQKVFASSASASTAKNSDHLIALYATHTDESYVPSDGTESQDSGGGILDVAEALKTAFEKQGVNVVLDKTSHLPHDSGAYRRSRQTAASLMKKVPDALIDVHRDGIPSPDEYITEIDGTDTTKVRLLVGRANANSSVNKEFAKKIKAVADEQYPGLVKDIFMGKGTYNQDLMPQAILLEFGTHTINKTRAIKATDMVATVMTSVLYGEGSEGTGGTAAKKSSGVGSGVIWLIVVVAVAALVYAFLATGSGRGMVEKLKRNTSELTGGLVGKKPDEDKDK